MAKEPTKNVPPPTTVQADEQAQQEDAVYEDYAAQQERRKDHFWQHAHIIAIGFIWIGAALALSLIVAAIVHIAGPEAWRWLDANDVEKLFALLSGAGAAVAFRLLRQYVD